MPDYRPLEWKNDRLIMLDQRRLPLETVYVTLHSAAEVAEAIHNMTIRGAPAIGVAAAYGLALEAQKPFESLDKAQLGLREAGRILIDSRPTAVNLAWAVNRVLAYFENAEWTNLEVLRSETLSLAHAIAAEEAANNRKIGLNALALWPDEVTFIHHCNTGALATYEYGTALGVIQAAHEAGKKVFVYVDETRPRLQGARLTAWELEQMGIPYRIIVDGASGYVLKNRVVNAVTVGCDRIAANGDTANKIGTYTLAIAARAHNVPFYVVGPTSTVDLNTPHGNAIPIEERSSNEITLINGEWIAPRDAPAFNPAFDVTPAEYITAIITEQGIARPPYEESLREMVEKANRDR